MLPLGIVPWGVVPYGLGRENSGKGVPVAGSPDFVSTNDGSASPEALVGRVFIFSIQLNTAFNICWRGPDALIMLTDRTTPIKMPIINFIVVSLPLVLCSSISVPV